MAGKKRTPAAPSWFDPSAYTAADTLDAGDWLLNLTLRRWLHDEPNPQTEAALRSAGPVLRRSDEAQMRAMHVADRHRWVSEFKSTVWGDPGLFEAHSEAMNRPSLPSDVLAALHTGRVPSGVQPLKVADMYAFERMLPEDVRTAGKIARPGESLEIYPRGFGGTLDDAFGPAPAKQMTGRFLRVDLKFPDAVLHADLMRYLASERRRLEAMGGRQPYREAARLKMKPHKDSLSLMSRDGLLPFLDLDRWQRAEGLSLSFEEVRTRAGIDYASEAGLRRHVSVTFLSQMQFHAWFARLERSVKVTPRARQSTR